MIVCTFGRTHAKDWICLARIPKARYGRCADGHDAVLVYVSCVGDYYCEDCPDNWTQTQTSPHSPSLPKARRRLK